MLATKIDTSSEYNRIFIVPTDDILKVTRIDLTIQNVPIAHFNGTILKYLGTQADIQTPSYKGKAWALPMICPCVEVNVMLTTEGVKQVLVTHPKKGDLNVVSYNEIPSSRCEGVYITPLNGDGQPIMADEKFDDTHPPIATISEFKKPAHILRKVPCVHTTTCGIHMFIYEMSKLTLDILPKENRPTEAISAITEMPVNAKALYADRNYIVVSDGTSVIRYDT